MVEGINPGNKNQRNIQISVQHVFQRYQPNLNHIIINIRDIFRFSMFFRDINPI